MLVRVSSMTLRISGALALILGLTMWVIGGPAWLVPIHMLLGLLVVIGLWLLSFAASRLSLGLAIGGFILGLIVLIFGATQTNISLALFGTNTGLYWITKIVHLLLGVSAIGLGEAIAGRSRRLAK
jgi:hypothetical protein